MAGGRGHKLRLPHPSEQAGRPQLHRPHAVPSVSICAEGLQEQRPQPQGQKLLQVSQWMARCKQLPIDSNGFQNAHL